MLTARWRIQLLGGLVARSGEQTVERFRTRKGGEMLAALALNSNGALSREELLLLLWPDEEPEAGRNRLRVELAALRRQFQTPGQTLASLIEADRLTVRLRSEAFTTDAAEFEQRLNQANKAEERAEQIALLAQVVEGYRGDLLPEFDAAWILAERERFASLHQEALRRIIRRLAQERDFDQAILYAQRAIQVDPWNEEAHFDLIRLFVAVGQPSAALRQYENLEQTLREQLASRPTAAVREFIQQIRERLGHSAGARAGVPLETPPPVTVAPPPPTAPAPSTVDLPIRLTRFFGREQEQERLQTLLETNRLTTITGPGGNGKTRLTIETAAALQSRFEGGARFVYLGNLLDVSQLPDALRQALRLPNRPGVAPLDQVITALSAAPTLLILDNFEHLVPEGVALAQTLLEAVPALTLAVTSRRVLGIPGEQEFPLAPLPVPERAEEPETLTTFLTTFASVRLFLDRAQAVRPDFQLTPRNAEAIADLCRYLEGIPLAIELAAARVRTLTPAQMTTRLLPRLELLVNPRADKDARHRSLRTTIAWSVQMLSPEARRFFARLSVFQGGWDVESAACICLASEHAEAPCVGAEAHRESARWSAFDLLERLLSESLILAEERAEGMRFRMLETLREFAWEQMPPPEQERMRRRHALYWMQFGEEIEMKMNGPELRDWLNRLEEERANLTAALAWCLEASPSGLPPSPTESGLRILGALWRFWDIRGSAREARVFTERLLAGTESGTLVSGTPVSDIPAKVLARAHMTGGALATTESDYPAALEHAHQSLRYWRQTGSPEGIGTSLGNLGKYYSDQGSLEEARRYYEEGLAIMRELGIDWRIATSLNNLGSLYRMMGDFDAAQNYLEEALALRKRSGDRRAIFSTLNNLAALAHHREDYVRAIQGQEEALAIARELEDRFAMAVSLVNVGNTYLALKDTASAHLRLAESLELHTAVGSRLGQAYALEGLATHAALTAHPERAGLLLGVAEMLREAIQAAHPPREKEILEASFAAVAADPTFLAARMQGRTLALDSAVALALEPLPIGA